MGKSFKIDDEKRTPFSRRIQNDFIKSAFKNGLSLPLKQAFPDIEPEAIPELVNHTGVLDPNWVSGFTAGDGCGLL